MKQIFKALIVLAIVLMIFSCKHSKEGLVVKDMNGNYYMLRGCVDAEEAYYLIKLDTAELHRANEAILNELKIKR